MEQRKELNHMPNLKTQRIAMIEDCLNKMLQIAAIYTKCSPGWTLIESSLSCIKVLHHLESETNFDEETLGVRYKDANRGDQ